MTQPDRTTFTWAIENFSKLDPFEFSSNFETKQAEFWLRLYPRNVLKDLDDHFAIYLLRYDPLTHQLNKVMWTIALINDKGEECYRKDIETKFTVASERNPIEGGLYHLCRDIILNPSSGLLTGDKLIIKSTVTILDESALSFQLSIDDNKVHKKTLENYQALLDTSKLSDVVFLIGEKEFKLHKAILASQSPVFSAMFESDLEEAKQNRVEIADIDVKVFEAMIRFIYSANFDSVQQCALELFVAADKYQIDSLKDICAQSLGLTLSIESVSNILLVADMHSAHELKSKCMQFINQNSIQVFATEGWKLLVKSRVELVVDLYYDLSNKYANK